MPEPIRPRRRPDVTGLELVDGLEKRDLHLVDPDPTWPEQYAVHEARVRTAVGPAAVDVERATTLGSSADKLHYVI